MLLTGVYEHDSANERQLPLRQLEVDQVLGELEHANHDLLLVVICNHSNAPRYPQQQTSVVMTHFHHTFSGNKCSKDPEFLWSLKSSEFVFFNLQSAFSGKILPL